jgi:choline dehydrogenase-like flavoprotein
MMQKSFTHIVVGVGSAGYAVAARMAENSEFSVLLVEAGPDHGADRVCDSIVD